MNILQEDRDNVLRARASGKGVLTAPFRLLKSNRLGVILTFAVYKSELPSNATPNERIKATDGYVRILKFFPLHIFSSDACHKKILPNSGRLLGTTL